MWSHNKIAVTLQPIDIARQVKKVFSSHGPDDDDARIITRGQSNLTKSASRGPHSTVRGHPRGSKVVPLNSWGRVSY